MNLRLLGNRILILPVTEETASGFIIPEAYRSFRTGIVKAVGNGARIKNGRRSIPLEVGQSVVLSDDYRMPIDIDGVQHFLINDEKVLCILEKQYECPVCGPQEKPCSEMATELNTAIKNG